MRLWNKQKYFGFEQRTSLMQNQTTCKCVSMFAGKVRSKHYTRQEGLTGANTFKKIFREYEHGPSFLAKVDVDYLWIVEQNFHTFKN